MIPEPLIKRFQELYKAHFGVSISSEEAQKQGLAVMRLVAVRQEELLNKEEEATNETPRNST